MLVKQFQLKQLVDKAGNIPTELLSEVSKQEQLALEVMEHFLGCTVEIRGSKFILTNLELYYGGIGDLAHDWYRTNFPHKYQSRSRTSKENAKIQTLKGPKIYLNHASIGARTRFDIVVGPENVAVSLLVRNAMTEEYKLLGTKDGQPNVVLNKMGLVGSDISSELVMLDTHDRYCKNAKVEKRMRYDGTGYTGFTKYNDSKFWNYSITSGYINNISRSYD